MELQFPLTVAYNMKKKKVGCPLAQAVLGATISGGQVSLYFDTMYWELNAMECKIYIINNQADFNLMVEVTKEEQTNLIFHNKTRIKMEPTQATVADLAKYDITVAIDRSGSMGTKDMPGGMSRWDFAKEAVGSLARKAATIDADGISVGIFGGSTVKMYDNVTGTDEVLNKIFTENEPDGGTPTHTMIATVVDRYLADKAAGKNPKPVLLAIATDGEPTDRNATKKVLVETANKLEADGEVAITFLQVGKDPDATSFLQELDDELVPKMGAKFDIVDTKQLEGAETITEKLVAAIND